MRSFNTLLSRASLILLALVLSACAIPLQVQTAADPGVHFGQYQTFGFVEPLGTDRNGFQSLVSTHLKAAATRELQARGLRPVDTAPQLLVDFGIRVVERPRLAPAPVFTLGFGLGRGHWGLGAGIPIYTDPRYTVSPAFGTLAIDLIDASRRRMIWEGLVIDVLPPTATPDQWQAVIDSAVQAAFARLPSVTGR